MRDTLSQALVKSQKAQEKRRVTTLRLIMAAIQDNDIALRGKGKDKANDDEIVDILSKMVKQREESTKLYKQGGRAELAQQEEDEVAIIKEFLPQQLSDEETLKIVDELIGETGANSLRDMGKIMGLMKERYRGQIDMGKAGGLIKSKLG